MIASVCSDVLTCIASHHTICLPQHLPQHNKAVDAVPAATDVTTEETFNEVFSCVFFIEHQQNVKIIASARPIKNDSS